MKAKASRKEKPQRRAPMRRAKRAAQAPEVPAEEQEAPAVEQQSEAPTPKPKAPEVEFAAPSVYRDRGFLVLVYDVGSRSKRKHAEDVVFFVHSRDGEHSADPERFLTDISSRMDDLNPHYLALNLLARVQHGTLQLRAKTRRKIADMIDVAELAKLSERQLAAEYKRIMGDGPSRIKAEEKEKRIAEMVAKVREDAAKSSDAEAASGTANPTEKDENVSTTTEGKKAKKAPAAKPAKEPKAKPAKEPKAPKAKEAKAKTKPTKEPKAPKEPKKVAAGENPYREGTMKAKGFDFYIKNKDKEDVRARCVEFMTKNGATEATAKGWYSAFTRV